MTMNIKKLVPRPLIMMRREMLPEWRKITKKNMQQKKMIPILHLHLADHCNLDCRGCDNFSPLAPEVFADTEVFEKDCTKMAELSQGRIEEIQLLGGEPLLHPQINTFMEIARRHFPTNKISIVSNGILLQTKKDDFWEACRNYKIEIIVTKYPIQLDFDKIKQKAQAQHVTFSFYGNTETVEKTMECLPLDLEGKQDPKDSFLRCARANRCVSLDNGKIYTCSLIPYVKYFNDEFGQNLAVTSNDFLDLHQAKNLEEILNFVCKPMPFCRFCNIKGTIWDIGYGISKKDISEWTGK